MRPAGLAPDGGAFQQFRVDQSGACPPMKDNDHSGRSDSPFRSIFDKALVGIAYTSADGIILEANAKLCEILGYTAAELRGLATRQLTHPEHRDQQDRQRQDLISGKYPSFIGEKRYVRKNGETLWIRRSVTLSRESPKAEPRLVQVIEDVSERRELEERFRVTFDHASVGILHSSLDRRILTANRKFCEMIGYTEEELMQESVARIHHPDDSDADLHQEKRLVAGEIESFSFEKRYVRKDESVFWANRTVSLARDDAGRPKYFIRVVEDITARKETEEKLLHLAHYDALTDVPNRALFHDRLTQTLAQARRRERAVAVMFLDVDFFKEVNDSFGHAMGDLLLKRVARRLDECVRSGDTVGRLSGDEFGIILGDLRAPQDAHRVARKILESLRLPFHLDGHEIRTTASIGISLYPVDGLNRDTLLRAADNAMYRAKDRGRNNYQFYADGLNSPPPGNAAAPPATGS
jgi:diguanylate cyclase (GGDEF)-like protein/PAS domain S-box-containing protein